MKKRKILSAALAGVMLISSMSLTAFAAYSDVSESHWAAEAIEKWSEMGIVQGSEGQFRPGSPITRGEFAVVVDRMMRFQTKGQNNFIDLDQQYYTEAMLKAAYAKVFQGSEGLVRPKDSITRQEAFVVLSRVLGVEAVAGDRTGLLKELDYADKDLVADWALGAVVALSRKGIVQGTDGKLNPQSSISRAEVMTLLDRSVAAIINKGETYTTSADGTVIVNAANARLKDMEIKGDLIVAQGVGTGDLTLENVTVAGRMIVRGGGENSIILSGSTRIQSVIVEKTDAGGIRIVTTGAAQIETIIINDGKDDVILTGTFGTVTVAGNVDVVVRDAKIEAMEVTAFNVTVAVAKGSEIKTVSIEGENAALTGEGKVVSVLVKANGAQVDTVGAEVVVAAGVTGTTAGGENVAAGETVEVKAPPSGGGGGGGGGVTPTTYAYNVSLTLKKGVNSIGTMQDVNNEASAKLDDVLNRILVNPEYTNLIRDKIQGKLDTLSGKTYSADGKSIAFAPDLAVTVNTGNRTLTGPALYAELGSKLAEKKSTLLDEAKTKINYDGNAATKEAYDAFVNAITVDALVDGSAKLKTAAAYTETLKDLLKKGYALIEKAEPIGTETALVDYLAGKVSTVLGIDLAKAKTIVNTIRDRSGDKSATAKEWRDAVGQSISITVDNDMVTRVLGLYLDEVPNFGVLTGSYTIELAVEQVVR